MGDDWTVFLDAELDRCWPWLETSFAVLPVPTYEKEHVRDGILRGEFQLWPAAAAAAVTTIRTYPAGAKLLNILVAGGDLKSGLRELAPKVHAFGKRCGCHLIVAEGRDGWARVMKNGRRVGATMIGDI